MPSNIYDEDTKFWSSRIHQKQKSKYLENIFFLQIRNTFLAKVTFIDVAQLKFL